MGPAGISAGVSREAFAVHTNSEVAETAFRSDEFAPTSGCDVVTSRKFVRFLGSAAHIDAPAVTRIVKVEKRIADEVVDMIVSKRWICTTC
jgi:hypothetical protein